MTKKTAVIIGASGLVGNFCLQQLLQNEDYSCIKIFARKPVSFPSEKIQHCIIDFDAMERYAPLIKGDELFCCFGATLKKAGSKNNFLKIDLGYPTQFAAFARQNGIKKCVLISSLDADEKSSNFYLNTKGIIEKKFSEMGFESLSIVRPSLILGDRNDRRFLEALAMITMKLFSFLFFGPLKKYKGVEAETVAKAMISIVQKNNFGTTIYESDALQQFEKD
ncbi:MAG: NAD(P)H-binding protein [Bacteroidia bacterium]